MESRRTVAEMHSATLYLLANSAGWDPWIAEFGTGFRGDKSVANIMIGYGAPAGPYLKVGTWDAHWAGSSPTNKQDAQMTRQNVGQRLAVASASFASDPHVAVPELMTFAATASWDQTSIRIDGVDHPGWSLSTGECRVSYTAHAGATVCIEVVGWNGPDDLVSTTDYEFQLANPLG